MAEQIDRAAVKREANRLLDRAQVDPEKFYLLALGLIVLLDFANYCFGGSAVSITGTEAGMRFRAVPLFVGIITTLTTLVLGAGRWLYCMAVRRGERAEFLTVFDGFSFAGRLILLSLLEGVFLFLWSLPSALLLAVLGVGYGRSVVEGSLFLPLLLIPPLVAVYRYRFAILNLCEEPSLSPLEAINLSKRQTEGYKRQLLKLDLSFTGWFLISAYPAIGISVLEYLEYLGRVVILPGRIWFFLVEELTPMFMGSLFLPRYQMMELIYFETAKRTSGVRPDRVPEDPDGLGGWF